MTFREHFVILLIYFIVKLVSGQELFEPEIANRGYIYSPVESDVGNSCTLHDGSSGVCTIAKSCNWAKQQIKEKKLNPHQLIRCEFQGSDLVICCKTEDVKLPPRVSARKSDQACEKFKKIPNNLSFNVLNGVPAEIGEYPHMVALGYYNALEKKFEYNCGGSLISRNFVLTAAHCVNRRSQLPTQVLLGRISLEKELYEDEKPQEIEIKNIIIHNQFTSRKKYHDIALLELKTPAEFSNEARPACLGAPKNFVLNKSKKLTVTGWGVTNTQTRKKSSLLLKGDIDFVPRSQCDEDFRALNNAQLSDGIVDSQICAGDPNDTGRVDACQGDSGGPLQIKVEDLCYIVGVTSFGITCGSEIPGVYTNVTHYLDWIEEKVWPSEVD